MFKGRKFSVIGLLLVLLLSLSLLAGCGNQTSTQGPSEQTQSQAPATTETPSTAAPVAETPQVNSEDLIKEAAFQYYEKMPKHTYKITEDETKALLDSNELKDYLVLDIRTSEDYAKGHILGAVNLPYKQIGTNLDMVSTNAKGKKGVLVICYTGQTAGQAVSLFNLLGIPARSVNLGMKLGWEAKKYPTDTTPVQAIPAETVDWGDKVPIKEAVVKYFEKMPGGAYDQYKIALDDLKAQIDSNPERYVVLDIRTKEDYEKGTIKGAVNVPFKEVHSNFDKIAEMAKGKTLVVACYTGQTAGQTDSILNLMGIKTLSLHRGIKGGWVDEKGFELVIPQK